MEQNKLEQITFTINELFEKFKISEALMAIYKLVWDDFCSWYLEIIKPGFEQPIDAQTILITKKFFEDLLKLMHPFTPFVTEELWHLLGNRQDGNDIIIEKWPVAQPFNLMVLANFDKAVEVITQIRNIRKKNNIANKVKLELFVCETQTALKDFDSVIIKIGNLSCFEYKNEKISNSNSFIVTGNEYFIPFGQSIDVSNEIVKIKETLDYTRGFLKTVQSKLQNQRFVDSAPVSIVNSERSKEMDALNKIKLLEEKLNSFEK